MKRSRVWIWFFVILVVLTAVAATLEIWFNLSQQLNPDQLATAQRLWSEHAPASYELEYVLTRQSRQPLHYRAVIRDREVVAVFLDGQELEPVLYPLHDLPPLFEEAAAWLANDLSRRDGEVEFSPAANAVATYRITVQPGQTIVTRNGQSVPTRLAEVYLPTAQLAAFARQLDLDRQPGTGRLFCVATFDRQNGMPIRYVRSVTATRDRVQIAGMDRKIP